MIAFGATSQIAGNPTVLDRTVVVLDRTVIVLYRTVMTINGARSFPLACCGSDRLWLLRVARHTSTSALPTLSCLSGDRYVYKTLPRAGLISGARSCAFIPALLATWLRRSPRKRKIQGSSSSSSAIDSRAGQIFSPVDATKPAVRYGSSAEPHSSVVRSAPCGHVS